MIFLIFQSRVWIGEIVSRGGSVNSRTGIESPTFTDYFLVPLQDNLLPQLGNKFYTRVLSKYFKNFIYHSFQTSGLTNSLLFSEWKVKWWSGENRKARKEKWSHYLTRMEIFEFNSDKNFLSAIHRSISKHIKYRFYELEFYNPPMIFYPSYDRFLFYYVFIFDSFI